LHDEDASNFQRALGFCVDDDNDPAPENVSSPTENPDGCLNKEWNSVPYCDRRLCGASHVQPTLMRADQTLHTVLGFFIHIVPVAYFKTTVIAATNVFLSDPLFWEEFLRFLGLIFLMTTSQGSTWQEFWANDVP
jgi:hypothetical protein